MGHTRVSGSDLCRRSWAERTRPRSVGVRALEGVAGHDGTGGAGEVDVALGDGLDRIVDAGLGGRVAGRGRGP